MQIHNLQPKTKSKNRKYIGRGGKRGTTAGRGTKGQKARSGHRIRPAERDILIRLPKLRGFRNKPLKSPAIVVNVGDLEKRFNQLKALKEKDKSVRIKVLGNGEIKKSFEIKGWQVSESAKKKIEAAGGKIL